MAHTFRRSNNHHRNSYSNRHNQQYQSEYDNRYLEVPPLRSRIPQYDDSQPPSTPPSIRHMGTKIPLTDFFPGQKMVGTVVTYTPDTELPSDNEPIEAGRLPKKNRARNESVNSSSSRRGSLTSLSQIEQFETEDAARVKRKEEAYKTALCDAYRKNSECSYGKQCRFAHGEHELRLPPQPRGKAHPKYKTQLCDKFSVNGFCPYGPRCQFIHMMKKGLPLVEYEKKVRNGKISPTRECIEFIDEDDMESSYTRNNRRPYTEYQVDPRFRRSNGGSKEHRRRSTHDDSGNRGPSRYDSYDQMDRVHRYRSEPLHSDMPRVTYEKIPTTPKRAPVRPKELSLIHEETEEHESPPSSACSTSTTRPAWVSHFLGHTVVPPHSPRLQMPRSKMAQIDENDAELLSESCDDQAHIHSVPVQYKRSNDHYQKSNNDGQRTDRRSSRA